jgi:hypothetical protein
VVKNARAKSSKRGFYAALAIVAGGGRRGPSTAVAQQSREDRVERVAPVAAGEAKGQLLGDPNAPVQIVEFADFECRGCAQFAIGHRADVRTRIVTAGLASFRFYDFPLEIHPNSPKAHMAAACAADQGKFWEMHDRVFAGQNDWNTRATRNPKGVFEGYAREIGLDGASGRTATTTIATPARSRRTSRRDPPAGRLDAHLHHRRPQDRGRGAVRRDQGLRRLRACGGRDRDPRAQPGDASSRQRPLRLGRVCRGSSRIDADTACRRKAPLARPDERSS